MAYITDIQNSGSNVLGAIAEVFANLRKSLAESREFRRTYDELNSLSTRELDDLGIARCDIARLAYESVYKK